MFANKLSASVLTVLLVVAAVGPAAMAASSQGQAYAGTHVSFDTTNNAVVDYTVDGETMFESAQIQSQSDVQSQGSAEANITGVTDFAGAALSVGAELETSTTVSAESGAEMRVHDSDRGILVISSGEQSQYVGVNLSGGAQAETDGDGRVVVTTDDGARGTFIVVGDGAVTVNDEGNVTAELDADSQLVFRAYGEERTSEDQTQEALIANGTAAAEVYVTETSEAGSETTADVVHYGENTTVEVTQKSEGEIRMTAERTESEGRVVITSVSESVIDATEDLSVMVDGEAAVEASSYSELEGATEGGDTSKFLVRQSASTEATADVLIGVNHFSERDIVMRSDAESEAYAGAHTSFNATANAIADYEVDGETMFESAQIQSKSQAWSQADLDAGVELSAVTSFLGAGLSMQAESETSATMSAESGAEMRVHDSDRGILVISSGEQSQYVGVNLSGGAQAETDGDGRVVVTTDDGARGTFIVVGDGAVTVNDEGNVTAELDADSQLVFRAYGEERTSEDQTQEALIANGTAAAEVYVTETSEAGSETTADVVHYGENTTVEVTQKSEGEIRMTAERTESEGRVVITSVSESVIDATEDLSVMVDGEAAVEASSYSELESATEGGDTSKFLVRQSGSTEATADILIALNHFSERDVTVMESDDGGMDGTDTDDSDSTDGTTDDGGSQGLPGFGVGVALVALLAAALLVARNQ
jgi:PGF-CTERM protein